MKSFRIMLLLGCLFALLTSGIARQHSWRKLLSPFAAFAQDLPAKEWSAFQNQQQTKTNEDDQDAPLGQTAISVSVDLVSLQVLVTDKKGNVVTGLKPENFTIYEDNVKQEISHFSPVEANITAVMLVEYSRQISYFIYEVFNAMYYFARNIRQGDWIAVVGYDMEPKILCDFTQDQGELEKAFNSFGYPTWSESNLSDALIDTLDRIEEIEGKTAVILISTGLDTFSRHTYDEALQKCKETEASIFAISLGQSFRLYAEFAGIIGNSARMDLMMADNRLRSFAEYTGGAAYFPRFESELVDIFKNISQLQRSQYSIAYASSNTKKDGKYRKIRVEVSDVILNGKPVELKALTRKGYVAKES